MSSSKYNGYSCDSASAEATAAWSMRQGIRAQRLSDNWDFSAVLDRLMVRYRTSQRPVEVNFRKIVPLHAGIDRLTHLLHSYPAKLLLNIPLFFLHCGQLGPPGRLFDPFCGSGTVLVEGALSRWEVAGADSNPLARLITRTKLTYVDPDSIAKSLLRVCEASSGSSTSFSPVVNVNLWFAETAQRQIGGLFGAIAEEPEAEMRHFLRVCLSSCIRKASFADPRLSVPVRVRHGSDEWHRARNPDVTQLFVRSVVANCHRVAQLETVDPGILQRLQLGEDARHRPVKAVGEGDVDLVITSPPYVGAQKYVRASSLSIGWLGLAPGNRLPPLERVSIGREHHRRADYRRLRFPGGGLAVAALKRIRAINPLRAHIASTYLDEMRDALATTVARLKHGGRLVLVVGNNTIGGERFHTSKYLKQILLALGLELEVELLDNIRSRGLMTKRNKTAGVITREHIQLFVKP